MLEFPLVCYQFFIFLFVPEYVQKEIKNFRFIVFPFLLGIASLPVLNASHWTIYCLFVKLLHSPNSPEDINFAEKLINYYCRTIPYVYDGSLELLSLHAHLHLPAQVRLHGGLSTSSVRYSFIKYNIT